MKQVVFVKCDNCGNLNKGLEELRICNLCSGEGCLNCVRTVKLKKSIVTAWFHDSQVKECYRIFGGKCIAKGVLEDD